jgi:hypothetical protein
MQTSAQHSRQKHAETPRRHTQHARHVSPLRTSARHHPRANDQAAHIKATTTRSSSQPPGGARSRAGAAVKSRCLFVNMQRRHHDQFLMNCLIPRYSNPFLFRGYVSRSPPLARAPLLGVVVAAMSPRTLAYHARNHLPTYTCARPLPRPLCEHTAAAHAAQHGSNLHTAHRRATAGPEERRGCRC